jgi:hypothetical protein
MTELAVQTDTSDMLAVHGVFRECLADAPALIRAAQERPEQAKCVAAHLDLVLRLLHVHHEAEDELLTPKLLARCSPLETHAVQHVADQHAAMLGGIARTEELLPAWRAEPTAARGASLTAALTGLQTALTQHLDDEERDVLPIAARYVTPQEWGQLPGHSLSQFSVEDCWILLGLVQEQMPPDQAAALDAHLPPPLAESWATTGRTAFREYRSALAACATDGA